MKKISIILVLLFWISSNAISQNSEYLNFSFIKIQLIEKKENIGERELTNNLMQNTDISFCMVEFSKRELIVLIDSNKGLDIVLEKLNELGFTSSIREREKYSDELFIKYYYASDLLEQSADSEVPKINTRFPEKDAKNYEIIKSISK